MGADIVLFLLLLLVKCKQTHVFFSTCLILFGRIGLSKILLKGVFIHNKIKQFPFVFIIQNINIYTIKIVIKIQLQGGCMKRRIIYQNIIHRLFRIQISKRTMNINTLIIAQPNQELIKTLQCLFDHPYTIIEDKHKSILSQAQVFLDKIIINAIQPELTLKQQNICFVFFNIPLQNTRVEQLADKLGNGWKKGVYEFDPRKGNITQLAQTAEHKLKFTNLDATYILQFQKNQNQCIRLYFLPIRSPTHPNSNSRLMQQTYKICRIVKSFLSFQHQNQDSLDRQDKICLNLSEYLYLKNVSRINFILNLSEEEVDKKILQKVGEIKLHQEWLQKQEYRKKKQQIYCLYRDEQLLLKNVKKNKIEMLQSINQIRKLIGLKEDKYEDITIQTLRKLRAEGLKEKVAQLKELEMISSGLEVRFQDLQNRRKICQQKKRQFKKIQVNKLLNLKNEVLTLKLQQQTQKFPGTQRFIYNRSQPVHNRPTTSTFLKANKKIEEINEENFSLNRNTNDKTTRLESELQKQNKRKYNEFKFAEKKVATVIKEGSTLQQLDIFKIREDYQNQIINIDFQIQKKLLAQQNRYKKATFALQRLMQLNQDLNIKTI